jgi:hypothetical protein
MGKLLLNGCDAPGVLALNHIGDLFRQFQSLFLHDLVILNNIDRDVVVNVAQNLQVDAVKRAFDLYDVLAAHFAASGVFYDGYLAFQLVQAKVVVNVQAFSRLDVVKDDAFA